MRPVIYAILAGIGVIGSIAASAAARPRPVIALDCYHNQQKPPRYTWSQKGPGGYSQLGTVLTKLGADVISLRRPITGRRLTPLSIFILVDPNTRHPGLSYAPHPHYIRRREIRALVRWVRRGGTLVTLGNNAGNCEFKHLNQLASHFGIHFNDDTADTGGADFPIASPAVYLRGVHRLFMVGICSLRVTAPARAVVICLHQVLMADAQVGRGYVFAAGDPWLYNEHLHAAQNLRAGRQLFAWLMHRVRR